MIKKDQPIQKEALEIIELAISDVASLAQAFGLVSDLSSRGFDFSDVEFDTESEIRLH